MNLNNNQSTFDRGISPVIGVILMVVITVVLGAIVANYMLDFGDQANQGSATAGVTLDAQGDTAEVSYASGGSAEEVIVEVQKPNGNTSTTTLSSVGESWSQSGLETDTRVSVYAVANGQRQLIDSTVVTNGVAPATFSTKWAGDSNSELKEGTYNRDSSLSGVNVTGGYVEYDDWNNNWDYENSYLEYHTPNFTVDNSSEKVKITITGIKFGSGSGQMYVELRNTNTTNKSETYVGESDVGADNSTTLTFDTSGMEGGEYESIVTFSFGSGDDDPYDLKWDSISIKSK